MAATLRSLLAQRKTKKKREEMRKQIKKKKNWPLVRRLLEKYNLTD